MSWSIALVFMLIACDRPQLASPNAPPAIIGIDHIPIAVRDLHVASSDYEKLGFVLKPGRFHDNGIENRHVKFLDGTELELITSKQSRDALSSLYVRHLAEGEGPAFLGLYAPDQDRADAGLAKAGIKAAKDQGTVTFTGDLEPVFLAQRQKSPTDRPEHFAHPNTAQSVIGVWWASDGNASPVQLMAALGAPNNTQNVCTPTAVSAVVASMPGGGVTFLPARSQVVSGHPIAGVVVAVRDVAIARKVMVDNGLRVPDIASCAGRRSLFLPPTLTHGFWLELRQV